MAAAAAICPTLDSGMEALAAQTALLVADGSCPKIRELLAEALVPVLWLEAGQPPLETVTTALAERRRQGQPVKTLHWVSHGRPGVLLVGQQEITSATLLRNQRSLAGWQVNDVALWACNFGLDRDALSLWQELAGAWIWSSKKRLGTTLNGTSHWAIKSTSDKDDHPLALPIPSSDL